MITVRQLIEQAEHHLEDLRAIEREHGGDALIVRSKSTDWRRRADPVFGRVTAEIEAGRFDQFSFIPEAVIDGPRGYLKEKRDALKRDCPLTNVLLLIPKSRSTP